MAAGSREDARLVLLKGGLMVTRALSSTPGVYFNLSLAQVKITWLHGSTTRKEKVNAGLIVDR